MDEQATFEDLCQTYSDVYKELHNIRPRWARWSSYEEVSAALDLLFDEVEELIKERDEREREEKRLAPPTDPWWEKASECNAEGW